MSSCETHGAHEHQHGPACGHVAVKHGDHVDYLHDGHLHHGHGDHVDEHRIEVDSAHPNACAPTAATCGHVHGPDCGHPAVPHGDHTDYLVDGILHHVHEGHCDHHGELQLA